MILQILKEQRIDTAASQRSDSATSKRLQKQSSKSSESSRISPQVASQNSHPTKSSSNSSPEELFNVVDKEIEGEASSDDDIQFIEMKKKSEITFHYEVEKIKWAKPEEPEIVQLLPLVLVSEEKDRPRCDESLPPTGRVESPPLMTKFQHLPKIPGVGDLPDKPQAQGNLLSVSERTSDEMERLSPPSSFMLIIFIKRKIMFNG